MVFRAKREAPKPGQAFLMPASEEDGVILGKDGHTVFFKEDFTIMVAELSDSDKIVFEGGHDLGITDRYVRKWEVAYCGGLVGLAGCITSIGGGSIGADIHGRGVER